MSKRFCISVVDDNVTILDKETGNIIRCKFDEMNEVLWKLMEVE